MSDKWEYLGENLDPFDAITGGIFSKMFGTDHTVKNNETGEMKTVTTFGNEKVGEVIEKGGDRLRDVY